MIKKPYGLLLLFLVLSLHCTNCRFVPGEKIRYQKNSNEAKKEILKHITTNSSIANAQQVMESDHFKCKMFFSQSYLGIGVDEKRDFLWCDKSVYASMFVERRYQFVFVNKNGFVSDISVSVSLTGL